VGVKPNSKTLEMVSLEHGIDIHQSIKDIGILLNVVVATTLRDLYEKCGSIYKELELFDTMLERNVVSWNAMIARYARNEVFIRL